MTFPTPINSMKPELRKARSLPSERRGSRRKPSMEFTASLQAQAVAARAKYQATVRAKFGIPTPSAQTVRVVDEALDSISMTSTPPSSTRKDDETSIFRRTAPLVRTRSRSLAPSYAQWDPYSERVADWNLIQSERPITIDSELHVPRPLNVSRKSSVQSENPLSRGPVAKTPTAAERAKRHSKQQSGKVVEVHKPRILVERDIKPPIPRRSSKRLQVQAQPPNVQRYSFGQTLGLSTPAAQAHDRDAEQRRHDSVVELPDTGIRRSGDQTFGSIRLIPPSPVPRERSRSPANSTVPPSVADSGRYSTRLPDFTHEVHHYHILRPIVPVIDMDFSSPPKAVFAEEHDRDDGEEDAKQELSNHMGEVVKRFFEKAISRTNLKPEADLRRKSSSNSLLGEKTRERTIPNPERAKYKTVPWWVQRASPTMEEMDRSSVNFIPEISFDLGDLMPEELQPQVHRSNSMGRLLC